MEINTSAIARRWATHQIVPSDVSFTLMVATAIDRWFVSCKVRMGHTQVHEWRSPLIDW